MKIEKLKYDNLNKQFEEASNAYINIFSTKHNIEFDGWVGGIGTSVAAFINQYFFDMHDIILDINSEAEIGLIMRWQDNCLERRNQGSPYIPYKEFIENHI